MIADRESTRPVGRLAPSPTGRLHLGHARTFLLAWWHTRSRGGTLALRLEDLDAERVKPGLADQCVRDLEWLGLDWDGAPQIQSEHASAFDAAIAALLERGLAYPCVCTRREIQSVQSAPHGVEAAGRYPGTCRERFTSIEHAERDTGRRAAVRFRVRAGDVTLDDRCAGRVVCNVAREVGDFPVARRLGMAAYQLAVVVDDAASGVTEIVRGDDLLPSAARQTLLREALGYAEPLGFHVPLVLDADGRRFAKRSDDLSLAQLRERGTDPRTIVRWVARRSGMPVHDRVHARDLLVEFDMQRVPRAPLVCTPNDLAELAR
ncbi:MAG: tRNA glutamyl-Q(34) synthetase GluQRS [Planctomycetota bacterium]